jgi:hypothetical protein
MGHLPSCTYRVFLLLANTPDNLWVSQLRMSFRLVLLVHTVSMNICCDEGRAGKPLLQGIPQGSVSHVASTASAAEKLFVLRPGLGLDLGDNSFDLHALCCFGVPVLFPVVLNSGF